jgi:hypothetical protein
LRNLPRPSLPAQGPKARRLLPRRMNDRQNPGGLLPDAVDDDLGQVGGDRLARPLHASGPVEFGMVGKRIDGRADRGANAHRRFRVILGDEFPDRFEVVARAASNDLHTAPGFLWFRSRKLVIGSPRFEPIHNLLVRHARASLVVFGQSLLDVSNLPGIEVDLGLDRFAREI